MSRAGVGPGAAAEQYVRAAGKPRDATVSPYGLRVLSADVPMFY